MTDESERRAAAIRRLKAKRGFQIHAAVFVIINILLVAIWASTGSGYFWPIWPFLGWGIGLALHRLERLFPGTDFGRRHPPGNGEGRLASLTPCPR